MRNNIIKSGLINSFYVIVAQSISLILGIARTLMLPVLLGVTNFGYWQIYLLYMSYVGIFSLGFNDGIYLRYGKYDYGDLPKETFRSCIKYFIVIQLVVTFLVSLIILLEPNINKQISMLWAAANIPIAGLSGVFIYVLQITNQLKKYSLYSILDKIMLIILILVILINNSNNYLIVIVADTLSRLFVLILMSYSCRDLIFGKSNGFKIAKHEIFENIRIGIKLMISNFTGMLVLGYGRFLVERFESVEVYGAYSFAISAMNLVLVFVAAIGLVIYPTLNRLDNEGYPKYFSVLNKIIIIATFGFLVLFFPLRIFISIYMQEYKNIFAYLPMIFAIVFLQAKMQILINPYYKVLRKEKEMLSANINGLFLVIFIVTPIFIVSKSVAFIAFGTYAAMGIRLYLSELFIRKSLSIKLSKCIIIEITLLATFVFCGFLENVFLGFLFYTIVYISIIFSQIKFIMNFFTYLKGR